MTDKDKKIETWDVAKLRPHPQQARLFPDPPQHEVEELAGRIKADGGMLCEIEALPDGTIICGHKRRLAALLLGWKTVGVWVRDDLAAQGPSAVEARLIWDNLGRRQMGYLEMARAYQHLKTQGQRRSNLILSEVRDLRDQIGERLRISGRNLDRYLRVLEGTPQEVQDAVTAETLPVTVAEKVAGLTEDKRKEVAAAIRAGGEPREVVRQFLPTVKRKRKKAWKALVAFEKVLEQGLADLEGRLDEVGPIWPEEQDILKRAGALIEQLLEQARRQRTEQQPSREEELRAAAEEFHNGAPDQFGALDADEQAGGPDKPSGGDDGQEQE